MKRTVSIFVSILSFALVISSCKKESCDLSTIKQGEFVAQDGIAYPTVLYPDGKEWFAANLKTLIFANGDSIALTLYDSVWTGSTIPRVSYYDNDISAAQFDDYGLLYNYYAVEDNRKVCPDGWHVANAKDWEELVQCVGGSTYAGNKLKSNDLWNDPSFQTSDNESGFSAPPQGLRLPNGDFQNQRFFAYYWATEDEKNEEALIRNFSYLSQGIGSFHTEKNTGASVRCVRD